MMRWLQAAWDRLTLYLPILLMAFFALGSWWLVRTAPSLITSAPARPVRHDPDYFLNAFSIRTFDAGGQLKNEVFGADARHYPDTDTMEIENVRMRSLDAQGRSTVATAKQALSNRDGSDVQLFGRVHVTREAEADSRGTPRPPMEFRSEYLRAQTKPDRLSTHLPVVIEQGRDRLSGSAMSWDHDSAVLELAGRVKGELQPRTNR